MGYAHYQKPYRIFDAGGNSVYESATFLHDGLEEVLNSGAAAIGRGEAVYFDEVASFTPRWDYAVAGTDTLPQCQVAGKRVDATGNLGFVGVAQEVIPIGAVGRVATTGALTAVKSLTAASLTNNLKGSKVTGSATAGSVNAATAVPAVGATLGSVYSPAGTGAGQSGSLTQLFILIAQE